jgi:hypothetical protein
MNIPKSLKDAYRNTNYFIYVKDQTYLLNPYTPPPQNWLDFMQEKGIYFYSIITAFNPNSIVLDEVTNKKNNQALESDLALLKYEYFKAIGVSKDSKWSEESFCTTNITKDKAKDLANKYSQNAILIGNKTQKPKLIFI